MITKISTKGMSRDEWVKARMDTIGGSDASAVMGLNPYKSPYSLWAEKTGKVIPEDISKKESVRLGVELEDYVARRFTEETGKKVRRETSIIKNSQYPFAHANVDRMVIGEDAGLECKTTSILNLRRFKDGEYPAEYYCQCVHYLAVTGKKRWYLAVLVLGQGFYWFCIERDEAEINALMESEEAFWDRVKSESPPDFVGSASDSTAIGAMYPGGEDKMVDLFGLATDATCYNELGKQIKALKRQQEIHKLRICEAIGNNNGGFIGDTKVTWKNQEYRKFQEDAFRKAYPHIDLAPYFKVSETRVFKLI